MSGVVRADKEFKEAVGGFIIAFSELEFGLAVLCSMTEPNLNPKAANVFPYMQLPFTKKVQHLSKFLRAHHSDLYRIWERIVTEVNVLNNQRRFIAHGFFIYGWHTGEVATHIAQNGSVVSNELTVEKIRSWTDRLLELISGDNGIRGEFHTLFLTARLQKNK